MELTLTLTSLLIVERRPVIDYEGVYSASSDGYIIRNSRRRKSDNALIEECVLLPFFTKVKNGSKGYACVTLSMSGKTKKFTIHKLVYEAFNGRIKTGNVIDHIDCCKQNNSLLNLEEVSFTENIRRAFCNGLYPLEHDRSYSVVTKDNLLTAIKKVSEGYSFGRAEYECGLPLRTLRMIKCGKSFRSYRKLLLDAAANTEIKHTLKGVAHRNA